jgi:hypothetical protein
MPKYRAGARVRGARERGGPQPRAERTLERGETRSRGSEPSSGAGPLEGRVAPRTGRNPFEEGVAPRTGQSPLEEERPLERGGACSRGLLDGPSWWASGVLPHGLCPARLVSCMVRLGVFRCRDLSEGSPIVYGDP